MEDFVRENVLSHLNLDRTRNMTHFIEVRDLAKEAVKQPYSYSELSSSIGGTEILLEDWQKEAVVTAAFLHDLNYKKLQKDNKDGKWVEFVLDRLQIPNKEAILTMIDLVPYSKWGDRTDGVSPNWYYIVRYCNRLTAIGERGLVRCLEYTLTIEGQVYVENTPVVHSIEELEEVASKERYLAYSQGKKSESTIDYIYDKLLHIQLPDWFSNPYLEKKYAEEKLFLQQSVINYWN